MAVRYLSAGVVDAELPVRNPASRRVATPHRRLRVLLHAAADVYYTPLDCDVETRCNALRQHKTAKHSYSLVHKFEPHHVLPNIQAPLSH